MLHLMRRNPLLSHLSPSMLSKMSLAVLATFSTPLYAGDIATAAATSTDVTDVSSAPVDTEAVAQRPEDSNKITARAEQMTGRPDRILNFDGQVEIVRGPSTLNADTAEYHAIEDLVMAHGNVQMLRNKDCYSGDTFQMQMDTGSGYLTNPVYQLEKNNARGFATRMDFIDKDQSVVEQGVYTTCEGTKPDWYLRSSRLDLDTGRDEGVATNGVVFFKDVPILGSPWMSFPISDARRSGVLPPEFSSTTTGGAELTVPYYFDIAPNRDATIFPNYISKRGEQLGGEFRYLDSTYSGLLHAEITPQDAADNNDTRYSISYLHNQTLLPGLTMSLNYNRASDDNYAIDYSHSITQSSQHLLPQMFTLGYGQSFWNVGLTMLNYQVLQIADVPLTDQIQKPYQIMPQLLAHAGKINDFGGFDWSIDTQYTNFRSSTGEDSERFVVQPQISYPITGTYYFITPKFSYHLSEYRLGETLATSSNSSDPVLSVPTFSLDSGLYFEREANLFGRDLTQTLEPRLFYVNTPYRDQTNVPIFDTGIADINFAQIFTENRFSGQDRVGDANQLTAALITRAIEMDGQERMRFAIAQRLSFSQPLVTDTITPFYSTTIIEGNNSITTTHSSLPSRSDLIFAASGKLTNTLTTDALWQYSQSQQSTAQLTYGFKWQPAPMQVINAEYRFQNISEVDPEGMKQIDVSAQWPLAPRWYGVARANYSIQDRRILDGLIGFEYKQDCWIFRAVAQRYLVPSTVAEITSSSTTSLFFQLELNGLSKIGTNPLQALKRSIPGYQPINQPTTQPGYQQNNF
ncbi:LPS-assembly protein LptD [Solimicrobium silvestre]|uniref:LPS-assembly protein LptD n=1 Tax=Solimicrobium silvestre TaxID=2099400 RepID=A0A2S9H1L4_9BURK|nr:LPS-assembly protein LptD [Solimicrobium silvestre]PRC93756.1 Organic solvent tolerance protein OstA [Solimicrobium silvestre]